MAAGAGSWVFAQNTLQLLVGGLVAYAPNACMADHYVCFLGSGMILCPSCGLLITSYICGVLGVDQRSCETLHMHSSHEVIISSYS